jgi:D-arabinose 1-dehydrogenase-like Zn-dependent alcohol dehydrogenase
MEKKFINPSTLHPPRGYTHVVTAEGGRTVFVSGQVSYNKDLQLVGAGDLKPVIDRTFPLTQVGAVEAHHYLHARKNTGKVVLEATDATDERPARSAR